MLMKESEAPESIKAYVVWRLTVRGTNNNGIGGGSGVVSVNAAHLCCQSLSVSGVTLLRETAE